MKTWRERIAEDRAAGKVSVGSLSAWTNSVTCPVGTGVAAFGVMEYSAEWAERFEQVDKTDDRMGFSGLFLRALQDKDWDAADRILDEIDDRVLELKREAGS